MSIRFQVNQTGMATPIVMAGVALGGIALLIFFSSDIRQSFVRTLRNIEAASGNDIMLSRATHAIALGAIQCRAPIGTAAGSEPAPVGPGKGQCRWNPATNYKPADFGFRSSLPTTYQDVLQGEAEACLPNTAMATNADSEVDPNANAAVKIDPKNCTPTEAKVSFELVKIDNILDSQAVPPAEGDLDRYGVLTTVKTQYTVQSSEAGVPLKQEKTNSAVVRRPRIFLRFELGSAFCERACTLAQGLKRALACISPIGRTSDVEATLGSSVPVTIWNDGPGYIYRIVAFRRFIPNPDLSTDPMTDTIVFDSAIGNKLPEGLAPGKSITFIDSGMPCYNRRIYTTATSAAKAGTTETAVTLNRLNSGQVIYFFKQPEKNDPANVLTLTTAGTSVQAREITTTEYFPPPAPPPATFTGGEVYSGGGGTDGGGGGGGGGDGGDGGCN